MAFIPSSTIYFCNVDFDSTYKHQVRFETGIEQQNYFLQRVVKQFSNYLTVRKSLPDGSFQSSVKVDANIDTLQGKCNYMFYQNAHHGTKYFYAFITKYVYVNESTTEVIFDTDVYQTWVFDALIRPSYVVREHSKSDEVGENLVPEKFNFQDYNYESALVFDNLDKWGYLIASANKLDESVGRGQKMSGIYQGLYFYYFTDTTALNDFLNTLEGANGDCIQSISLIPQFCVSNNSVGETHLLGSSNATASHSFEFSVDLLKRDFDGYKPKNRKLYTAPYFQLYVTNHNGEEVEYPIENFTNNGIGQGKKFQFALKGDVSINPSVTLYPYYYKGVAENYDSGISISGFPQCAFNSDTFKLWLAKNQFGIALDTASNVGQIVAGVTTAVATGGAGSAIGVGMVASGVSGIMGTMNGVYQASKEPNKSHSGSAKNNLLTAIKKNKFDIYYQSIKGHHARTIDDFFTMYGYQTNRVKVPNMGSRPYYNYVQTIDVNILGSIPAEDMKRLKQMYNDGVTFWKPSATVCDYSVDNSPTSQS